MILIEKKEQMRAQVAQWRRDGETIGLVPTMGYLHAGHLSLIERARKECDRVVVSIFVNPTQFGENEDFEKYPQDIGHDCAQCTQAGADAVFHPSTDEMYAKNYSTYVNVEGLTQGLCGQSRPTHFRGVCSVVMKLMHIVTPDRAYFGQKDAQQLIVVKRMVRDMDMPVTVVGCPIVRASGEPPRVSPLEGTCATSDKPLPSLCDAERELNGLALSSRNSYLNDEEQKAALVLSQALKRAKALIDAGERDAKRLVGEMESIIHAEPLARIDYVAIVDLETLKPIEKLEQPYLVALAVYIGKTRLIDNFIEE